MSNEQKRNRGKNGVREKQKEKRSFINEARAKREKILFSKVKALFLFDSFSEFIRRKKESLDFLGQTHIKSQSTHIKHKKRESPDFVRERAFFRGI